jgi:hypothetical protein
MKDSASLKTTATAATAAAGPPPVVTRLTSNIEFVAPQGCCASVLLRLLSRDDTKREHYYMWWLVVGRYDTVANSVPFVSNGLDTLRFDVPDGVQLSTEYLLPYLLTFVKNDPVLPGDTVVIKGGS